MKQVTISTHVLHLGTGAPAAGARVRVEPGGLEAVTDADGRVRFESGLAPGLYTLSFELGGASELYKTVSLEVRLDEPRHYHLPLLVSPYGVSAYRGS